MRLVVLGAPGAGKGTQARNLAELYNIPHVSSSDLLREHIKESGEEGKAIQLLMDNGQLAPDEVINGLVKEKVRAGKYVLDGFPRTLSQAETLDDFSKEFNEPVDGVVFVDVPDEIIVERISGRLTCPKCGAMFHAVYYPPKVSEKCDRCVGGLIIREDDKTRTVLKRLKLYREVTVPIIDFYKEKGILAEVSGTGEMQDITDNIVKALKELKGDL